MRAPELSFVRMTVMKVKEAVAEFTFNLGALFPIVKVEIV